jgi:hypothetical protein
VLLTDGNADVFGSGLVDAHRLVWFRSAAVRAVVASAAAVLCDCRQFPSAAMIPIKSSRESPADEQNDLLFGCGKYEGTAAA